MAPGAPLRAYQPAGGRRNPYPWKYPVHRIGCLGHTLDHIAYYSAEADLLFCGDTLFAGGCGRMFEGTAPQMHGSLARLATLPGDTAVYCAHEYARKPALCQSRGARQHCPSRPHRRGRALRGGDPDRTVVHRFERATNPSCAPSRRAFVRLWRRRMRPSNTRSLAFASRPFVAGRTV